MKQEDTLSADITLQIARGICRDTLNDAILKCPGPGLCDTDADCTSPQTCNIQTHQCVTPNECASDEGQACGTCGTYDCDGSCSDPCAGGGGGGGCWYEGMSCGGCGTWQCDNECHDPCAGGGGGGQCGQDCYDGGGECMAGYCVALIDPIILDVTGNGFSFTNVQNGVSFDFYGKGGRIPLAWTAANSGTAWLALDRNANGRIDSGAELFSNVTPQAKNAPLLGFKALAQYDLKENGGNGDGVIDAKDGIWSQLMLWEDKNHNGISEPGELTHISQSGITSISLDYQQKAWTDLYGNQFRYRAKINGADAKGNDKWAYDVVLTYTKK